MEGTPTSEASNTDAKNSAAIPSGTSQNVSEPQAAINPTEKPEGSYPKKGWPKGKKRKKIMKDLTAPRQPLTGYVRFLNDRREQFRAENPTLPFAEITKVLAAEWSALPADQKQQYLTAAEQDRERYTQELAAYKQSEAYRIFSEQQAGKKPKEEGEETIAVPAPETNDISGYDIPIFTEEFLDHNKSRETELRQLRKSNTDYEQQNATIQTYLSGLHGAVEKLSVETQQQRNNNAALQKHLQHLRSAFVSAFSSINIPGLEPPTSESIDSYMAKLLVFVKEEPNHPVISTLRSTVSQLDLKA